ncbi:MAG: hypothetical protein ACI8W3_003293, partial [Myxococcota bacterium]
MTVLGRALAVALALPVVSSGTGGSFDAQIRERAEARQKGDASWGTRFFIP